MPTFPSASSFAFEKVAIIGKPGAVGVTRSITELANFLQGSGRTVLFEAETAQNMKLQGSEGLTPQQIGEQADVAVVVGGDGTMLGIARQLAPYGVPLIGVNHGRLGFMTDIPLDRMMALLAEMLAGQFEAEQRVLLDGSIVRGDKVIFNALALNDVVVSRGTGAGMVELRVEIGGQFMCKERSDGLIVSTPTGSTAYALSAGGPLLHPTLEGIVLVPIAPHALSNRPIVVPDSSEIVIEVIGGRGSYVNFDMQSSLPKLLHHDRIVVKRSDHRITFLHPQRWTYYDTLRKKLHWNEHLSTDG